MLRAAATVLLLSGLAAGPVFAQEEDVGAKVEAIRQKVRDAAKLAREAQSAEEAARAEASRLLEGLGADAIPHLLKIVENADEAAADFDPDFIARARAALERLGWVSPEQKERMAELLQAIKDDDFDPLEDGFAVVECGLHAVKELDKALQSAELQKPEMGKQRVVMLKLLGGLGAAGRFEVLPVLVRHLGAKGAAEQGAAARGLGRTGDQPVDEMGEPDVARLKALDAAVTAHKVVAPLLALATHGADAAAREAATDALGQLKRKDAVAGLVALAGGSNAGVAAAANAALTAVTGQELEGAAWANWWGGASGEYPAQVAVPAKAPGR
ncbi:MAG: hypothetical protein ACYTGX_01070 [Planctomycetota bacterium]|jgi:hypothetical protein